MLEPFDYIIRMTEDSGEAMGGMLFLAITSPPPNVNPGRTCGEPCQQPAGVEDINFQCKASRVLRNDFTNLVLILSSYALLQLATVPLVHGAHNIQSLQGLDYQLSSK